MSLMVAKHQAIKYAATGIVSTLISASVIYSMMYFGINIYIANMFGYLSGIVFSYTSNSLWTFKSRPTVFRMAKFSISCGLSWGINIIAIKIYLVNFPNEKYISQLIGMLFYTTTGFFINKLWAMK